MATVTMDVKEYEILNTKAKLLDEAHGKMPVLVIKCDYGIFGQEHLLITNKTKKMEHLIEKLILAEKDKLQIAELSIYKKELQLFFEKIKMNWWLTRLYKKDIERVDAIINRPRLCSK